MSLPTLMEPSDVVVVAGQLAEPDRPRLEERIVIGDDEVAEVPEVWLG